MRRAWWKLRPGAAWLVALVLIAPAAHAGLFDDDEARKAILDLRQHQDETDARVKVAQAAQAAASAQLLDQVNQIKGSLLDLNNQIEILRGEIAKLRGQNEQIARDLTDLQRQQKDSQAAIDERLRKLEPQKVTLDGKAFMAGPEEQRLFGDAMGVLRKGDFAAATAAFSSFNRRYPGSGYNSAALYWLGNAEYGMREYKDAMASFRELLAVEPEHPRAPDALLSIANCQMELKDSKGARRSLDDLIKTYPSSDAAQAGKERLAALKDR